MQSLPFARFAGVSPNEKIRAFLARGNLTLCRFRLGQPAVVVYKAVFPTCSRGDARLTFQTTLQCKSGLREVVAANDAILALTAQGVWTVPLTDMSAGEFLAGPCAACHLPWGSLATAYATGPASWEVLLDGRGPPICRLASATGQLHSFPDARPVLRCVQLLQGQQTPSESHTAGGSLQFPSEAFSQLLGLRPADVSGPWPDADGPNACGLLMGFPDGRVFGVLLHPGRTHERCKAHLVCDLGQPVAAISCWQPGLPENKEWELLVLGSRCKVLSSHRGSWLEAWAPSVLEEPQELCCTQGPVVHWLHEGVPWEARLAIERGSGAQDPPSLHIQAGPLPIGRALSIQCLSSPVLSELWPQRSGDAQLGRDAGLLILDGCGGVRLVSPLPASQLSLKGLRPHPVIQARNDLLVVQAALQQLRRVRHNALPVTVERSVEDGRLVTTFPDASSAPNWIHAVGFDVGDRTICYSVVGPPSGGRPLRIHAECESAAVATAALVLPSREATGNPAVAFLKSAVVPSQTCTDKGPPQKTAVLSMASHLAPTGFGAAKRLSERLGLQAWPAHLESAGHGVLSLELELPGGHCWPALRAEALLRMLDVLRDHEESRVVPDVQVGERLETACRELERLLSKGQALAAYTEWRSRLGAALPLA